MSSSQVRLLRRQPYGGDHLGLVIGIDVGTTYSGVSYAVLRPGHVPEIQPVTTFSGQSIGNNKIPSVIYYDEDMIIKAVGAQTLKDTVIASAEEHEWRRVEHFKMHLRPSAMQLETNGLKLGSIPPGTTAEQVMGDFLRYLYAETEAHIKNAHAAENSLWGQVNDRITFILSHPNGWTGPSQQKMRQAAVLGGLIPDSAEGRERVKFVTEGEASALSCLSGGLGPARLEPGFRFVIADAGGGTLDINTYRVANAAPLELEEIATPDCRFAGSVFVNMRGRALIRSKLEKSRYNVPSDPSELEKKLDEVIAGGFEQKTKPEFDGVNDYGLVKVGERREKDDRIGIKAGFLKLSRDELKDCFKFSVDEAIDAIKLQLEALERRSDIPVWLVGGFAASPWLLKSLQDGLGNPVRRPDCNLSKAVANGAVLYYLDHSVTRRVCRATYGTLCLTQYNPVDPEHQQHRDSVSIRPLSGRLVVGPIFDCILKKGTAVEENKTFAESYVREVAHQSEVKAFTTTIHVYNGELPAPKWFKDDKEKIRTMCTLSADLSELCTSTSGTTAMGLTTSRNYWNVEFEIELKFGTTELEARVKWESNGATKYGPVSIVYEE